MPAPGCNTAGSGVNDSITLRVICIMCGRGG